MDNTNTEEQERNLEPMREPITAERKREAVEQLRNSRVFRELTEDCTHQDMVTLHVMAHVELTADENGWADMSVEAMSEPEAHAAAMEVLLALVEEPK